MNEQTTQTGARVIFIRAPKATMTEEQLRAALGSMSEDDPRWLAFNQLLDRALGAAMLDSSDAKLDATKGTHAGGRVAALADLKGELVGYRTAPLKGGGGPRNTRNTRK